MTPICDSGFAFVKWRSYYFSELIHIVWLLISVLYLKITLATAVSKSWYVQKPVVRML